MRKLFLASLLVLPSSMLAAQHAGTAAAAPAVHAAAPIHATPAAPIHSSSSHPAAIHHSSPGTHSANPSARLSTRGSGKAPTAHPVHTAWEPGLPPNPIAPIPSSLAYVNSVPTLFPFGHRCFSSFGCIGGPGNHFRNTGVVVPFGGLGGFYFPIPYYEPYADDQGGEPAPSDAQAAQNDAIPSDDNHNQVAAEQPAIPSVAPYEPPSQPIYDFVFVKRDGTKIFAVAYSLTKDKIEYVSKDGLRRTISLDALDLAATQKSNEERGNIINLPPPPPAAMAAL
jgi:hypothetical protein